MNYYKSNILKIPKVFNWIPKSKVQINKIKVFYITFYLVPTAEIYCILFKLLDSVCIGNKLYILVLHNCLVALSQISWWLTVSLLFQFKCTDTYNRLHALAVSSYLKNKNGPSVATFLLSIEKSNLYFQIPVIRPNRVNIWEPNFVCLYT